MTPITLISTYRHFLLLNYRYYTRRRFPIQIYPPFPLSTTGLRQGPFWVTVSDNFLDSLYTKGEFGPYCSHQTINGGKEIWDFLRRAMIYFSWRRKEGRSVRGGFFHWVHGRAVCLCVCVSVQCLCGCPRRWVPNSLCDLLATFFFPFSGLGFSCRRKRRNRNRCCEEPSTERDTRQRQFGAWTC